VEQEASGAAADDNTLSAKSVVWRHGGHSVKVFGSWDGWSTPLALQPAGEGHFELDASAAEALGQVLVPGRSYDYKFLVDTEWRHAPDLPAAPNEWGDFNNILQSGAPAGEGGNVAEQRSAAQSDGAPDGLFEDSRSYAETFQVRCYEVGVNGEASVHTLANILQESAANHCTALWGPQQWQPVEMGEIGLALVLTRLVISVDRTLQWGDRVRVETCFFPDGRLAARRDWIIYDAATGERVARATSRWVAFNLVTRRLAKIPENLRKEFTDHSPVEERFCLPEATETTEKLPEIAHECPIGQERWESILPVRNADMDMHGHMNNSVLVQMLLESLPPECGDPGRTLRHIEIEFKKEAQVGELLRTVACTQTCKAQVAPGEHVTVPGSGGGINAIGISHSINRDADMAELVRAQSYWTPGPFWI